MWYPFQSKIRNDAHHAVIGDRIERRCLVREIIVRINAVEREVFLLVRFLLIAGVKRRKEREAGLVRALYRKRGKGRVRDDKVIGICVGYQLFAVAVEDLASYRRNGYRSRGCCRLIAVLSARYLHVKQLSQIEQAYRAKQNRDRDELPAFFVFSSIHLLLSFRKIFDGEDLGREGKTLGEGGLL